MSGTSTTAVSAQTSKPSPTTAHVVTPAELAQLVEDGYVFGWRHGHQEARALYRVCPYATSTGYEEAE